MKPTPCLTPGDFAQLLDGQLPEDQGGLLRAHLTECSRCAAEWSFQRRLVERLAAPVAPASEQEQSLQRLMSRLDGAAAPTTRPLLRPLAAWNWLVGGSGLAAVAALAIFFVARPGPERGTFESRGAATSWRQQVGVDIHALQSTAQVLRPGASIARDTAFLGSYRNLTGAPAYLLAFAVDAHGEVHWLYPAFSDPASDPPALRLDPTLSTKALADSVVLEEVPPGKMLIITLLSPTPLPVSSIEALPVGQRNASSLRASWPDARIEELELQVK